MVVAGSEVGRISRRRRAGEQAGQAIEVGGDSGSVRTWWSGARDRTLHPEFELLAGDVLALDAKTGKQAA